MNTRQIAEEYRLAHWAGILQERKESGLSVKVFCEKAGFHQNIYFYWQRKLREAACLELQPVANAGNAEALVPQGWAVCEKSDTDTKESGLSIEIGKCRVNVGREANNEQLLSVCRMLESLC